MSVDTYFASRALGSTAIRIAAMQSVAHYRAGRDKEPTDAMTRGTAVHAAVLEPESIGERLIVAPRQTCTATTKAKKQCSKMSVPGATTCGIHGGDDEAAAWRESLPERAVVVPSDVMEDATAASEAIHKQLVRFGMGELARVWQPEVPMFATARLVDEEPGYVIEPEGGDIEVRCKIDFIAGEPIAVIGDLKGAARGIDPYGFERKVRTEGLHVQAALYVDIVRALTGAEPTWLWIAHESAKPWGVRVYEADPSYLDRGRKLVCFGLRRWAEYFASGDEWAGWPSDIATVTPPKWED